MRTLVRLSLAGGLLAAGSSVAGGQAPPAQQAPAQGAQPSAQLKLAYINSQQVVAQAPGRAEAEAQFEKEMNGYREQVKRMGDSLKTMIDEYNKQEVVLSPAAKESRQKTIRQKEEQYQQRLRQLDQEAQKREGELVRPIMEQINKVIDQIRAEEGYAMIFDAGGNVAVVVSADKSLDITDKVIARLKAAAPVASWPGEKPPAGKPPAGAPVANPSGVTRPNPGRPPAKP